MTVMEGKAIRVMVVDDNPHVREAIRLLLLGYDDIDHVAETPDGLKALDICAQLRPDVVVIAAELPELDGITATRAIRTRYPMVKVVVLTISYDKELERRVLQAGASA